MTILMCIVLAMVTIAGAMFLIGYIAALLDLADRPRAPAALTASIPPRVLLLGYHPSIAGGVTAVTRPLLAAMPGVTLLPIKHCYGAKDWVLYTASMVRLIWVLSTVPRPLVAHLIVASRGDRVRGVLPILLCRLLGVPICAHYHTNRGNMSLDARRPSLAH